MSMKQTAVAAGVLDAAALALLASGMYLTFGVAGAVVVLTPAILAVSLFSYAILRRKLAGEPLSWGESDSFGPRKRLRAGALYLVVGGAAMAYLADTKAGTTAAILVALGCAGFAAASLLLATHGD
jgi:hypothetical protein